MTKSANQSARRSRSARARTQSDVAVSFGWAKLGMLADADTSPRNNGHTGRAAEVQGLRSYEDTRWQQVAFSKRQAAAFEKEFMQRENARRTSPSHYGGHFEEIKEEAGCASVTEEHAGEDESCHTNDDEHVSHHDLSIVPAANYECKKRKRHSISVERDQCAFLRLWCKFMAMYQIPAESRLRSLAAPLLILCMRVISPFCSWAMSINAEIPHIYGIDLNSANPVEAALLLVHAAAAAKADQTDSDLYTIRNTEFRCDFSDNRCETMHTRECVGTSAMLLFLCGCMAGLHAFNVHQRFLLGAFQNTDPGSAQGRCPKRRQESACFFWLLYELQKLPEEAHFEIVNIINKFWRDNLPSGRHKPMFSSVKEYLLRNEVFQARRAQSMPTQATESSCSFTATRQRVAESKEETPSATADLSAAATALGTGELSPQPVEFSSQETDRHACPMSALASRMRMCKQELISYVMARATRLCQHMTGFYQSAIEDCLTRQVCERCCLSRVPQLRGDPTDVMYLDNSGQFAVREPARSEDISCPIS